MRPCDPLDALLLADPVELSLRPAFGVGNGDARVAVTVFPHEPADARRNLLRSVVPLRRQTRQLDVIEPVRLHNRADLPRQRPTGDDEEFFGGRDWRAGALPP